METDSNDPRAAEAAPWHEIVLTVREDQTELATAILCEHGFDACEVRESADGRVRFVVYAQETAQAPVLPLAAVLHDALGAVADGVPEVHAVATESWTENWKKYFPPTAIGKRLAILPPWAADQADAGRIPVVIHPGMAFGTGHHETTGSCLLLLDRVVQPGMRVLDVGCGSGILAIAALTLGASHAVAVDIDPEAVRSARENAQLNRVGDHLRVGLGDGPPAGGRSEDERFDVVVANIFAEKLVAMRERLTSCVKIGGFLILSGIDATRRSLIESAFVADSWQVIECVAAGEWVTFLVRHQQRDNG